MDRMRLYAMDDILGVLKKGASAIWDQRHALFPTLAGPIDRAITTAKSVISSLGIGGPQSADTIKAVSADHTSSTSDAMKGI